MKHLSCTVQYWLGAVILLWSTALVLGCPSGGQPALPDEPSPPAQPVNLLPYEETPGHIVLRPIPANLSPGDLVELVPAGPWPTGPEDRPGQAILLVTSVAETQAAAIPIGQRIPFPNLDQLVGRLTDRPRLELSKSVTWVTFRQERRVRLAAGTQEGVMPGDLFFVLGEPMLEPDRLGSRIIGLIRVVDSVGLEAHAEVLHEMSPIGAGQIAVFAQHVSPTAKRPEVTILFTRTNQQTPFDRYQLPPLASAVVEYQAEFQFSNIVVESLDRVLDPAALDAVEQAQEIAPDQGSGVIVFGQERDDSFLYNITTYGSSPGLVTSVGILPGGLPLAMPEGIEPLSRQLAPSFLATALTLRGEHAEAVYFLEYCLRHGLVTGEVAFHLREHLALRFETIGRPFEGLWLMTEDIASAHAQGNPFVELNALSIREYLHRSATRYVREFEDIEAFLERAEEVLPEESLLAERLERTRSLARLDRADEALSAIEEVLHQARRQSDLGFEVSSALARASFLVQRGDYPTAIQTVSEVLPDARLLDRSYPRYAHLLLAQYFTDLQRYEEAMLNLEAAIDLALGEDDRFTLANTYELAANIHFAFDRTVDAMAFMRHAVRLYGELDLNEDLARALFQAGMLEMNAAVLTGDERLVTLAYNDLARSSQLFQAIGDGYSASQSFGGLGLASILLEDSRRAIVNLGKCVELARENNDPTMVVAGYRRIAAVYLDLQEIQQARQALETARLWAATFGYEETVEEIDIQLRGLWSEV
ncbi:MAG: tetratricopeptide repeat protein [Bradymonadales bacterium]|nr:tetratricopeptide repeat protein [Bradymonadales bacterium]